MVILRVGNLNPSCTAVAWVPRVAAPLLTQNVWLGPLQPPKPSLTPTLLQGSAAKRNLHQYKLNCHNSLTIVTGILNLQLKKKKIIMYAVSYLHTAKKRDSMAYGLSTYLSINIKIKDIMYHV